ncbi:hypothetical protein ABKN59_000014 [Abortiporus biennis]
MSASPQPHSTAINSPEVLISPPVSLPPNPPPVLINDPPAQLASLLSDALLQVDVLKRELATTKRRADKAERLLAGYQKLSATANTSPPNSSTAPQFDEAAARLVILECEARVERAELERDELDARIHRMQEGWNDLNQYLGSLELRSAEVRSSFGHIMSSRGGHLIVVGNDQPMNSTLAQHQHTRSHSSSQASHQFPTLPPPLPTQSRVRPRAGSLDGSAYAAIPGGPPPSKRLRSDPSERDLSDRSHHRHYSESPSQSPNIVYRSNGQMDHPAQLTLTATTGAQHIPISHHHYNRTRAKQDGDEVVQIRYVDARASKAAGGHHQRHSRRGRSRSRSYSIRSRSRSRASSASLDEMLLEATTTGDDPEKDGNGDEMLRLQMSDREHQAQVPHHQYATHHRSRAPSSQQSLHPSASMSGSAAMMTSGPGVPGAVLTQPGQVPTYHTHIFAPPVTGAPVKKGRLTNTPSQSSVGVISNNGSVMTIAGVTPGAAVGGYPPTNAQGQRICRQCGLPGRYKDGKCVEKWGPGPEGPGTVCDRCRKKMKRVERRGTLESQHLNNQHQTPAAVHPSASIHNSMSNGRGPGPVSLQSQPIHRTDTIPAEHLLSHGSKSSLGPSGTHIISTSGSTYSRHQGESSRTRPTSPHVASSRSVIQQRPPPPSPPYIATLPDSSVVESDEERSRSNKKGSRAQAQSPQHRGSGGSVDPRSQPSTSSSSPPGYGGNGSANGVASSSRRGSPRDAQLDVSRGNGVGQSLSRATAAAATTATITVAQHGGAADTDADADADADAEADIDAEAEIDADADADLLEAVDAAEANNASIDEEWLKKEEL